MENALFKVRFYVENDRMYNFFKSFHRTSILHFKKT